MHGRLDFRLSRSGDHGSGTRFCVLINSEGLPGDCRAAWGPASTLAATGDFDRHVSGSAAVSLCQVEWPICRFCQRCYRDAKTVTLTDRSLAP